jgi:heptosyltransferase-2
MYPKEKIILLFEKLMVIYPNYKFKIFGIDEDKPLAEKFIKLNKTAVSNFCGELTLLETAKELDSCDVLISNDSGLMHLAAARKVPSLAIFGSTVPQFGFTPYGNRSEIVEIDLDCRPCTHIGRDKCPKGHFNCMNLIENDIILEKLERLLNGYG